jgi:hypothetical protein
METTLKKRGGGGFIIGLKYARGFLQGPSAKTKVLSPFLFIHVQAVEALRVVRG